METHKDANKILFVLYLRILIHANRNLNLRASKCVIITGDICIGSLERNSFFQTHTKNSFTIPVTISDKNQYLSTA